MGAPESGNKNGHGPYRTKPEYEGDLTWPSRCKCTAPDPTATAKQDPEAIWTCLCEKRHKLVKPWFRSWRWVRADPAFERFL